MLARIEKLWQDEVPSGQTHLVLDIGGQRYSLWDNDWMGKLQEGDLVEYDWKKAGTFRNITSIERIDTYTSPNSSKEKGEHALRMNCIKSASRILSDLDVEPKRKVQLTIAAARHFERYITNGQLSPDVETQDHPYQGLENDLDLGLSGTGRSQKPHP